MFNQLQKNAKWNQFSLKSWKNGYFSDKLKKQRDRLIFKVNY